TMKLRAALQRPGGTRQAARDGLIPPVPAGVPWLTYDEAATVAAVTSPAISHAVRRGALSPYVLPAYKARGGMRVRVVVLRHEVELWRARRLARRLKR